MPAQNNFKGKYQEGTFANGEGPIHGIEINKQSENPGLMNPPTSGRNLKTAGGSGDGLMAGSPSEKNFDLHAKPYEGPENWSPKNMGEVPNQPGQ